MKSKKTGVIYTALICFLVIVSLCFYPKVKANSEFKELIELFQNDESVKTAIEKGFAQHIHRECTDNNITFSVDDIVMDSRKLIIAFSIKSKEKFQELYMTNDRIINAANNKYIPHSGEFGFESLNSETISRGLYEITYDNKKETIPNEIIIKFTEMKGYLDEDSTGRTIKGNWNIQFSIDREKLKEDHPIEYTLNDKVALKDASFTVDYLKIYPTVMNLKVTMDENNKYYLTGFENMRIEDEKGNVYESTGAVECSKKGQISCFETPYFKTSKSFKLKCDGMYMMPKEDEYIVVDLENKKIIDDSGYNLKFGNEYYNTNRFYEEDKCDYAFTIEIEKPLFDIDKVFSILDFKEYAEDENSIVSDIIPMRECRSNEKVKMEYRIEMKDMSSKPKQIKFKVIRAYKYVTEPFEKQLQF